MTTLPRAVLFDVDGTLALRDESDPNVRKFYHWERVGEDLPNAAVVELAQIIERAGQHRIIVMSGRDAVCRPETEEWLHRHKVPFHALFMRPHKDNRQDAVVKAELYRTLVEPFYTVSFVVDDRDSVVKQWRSMGLTCMQVAEGAF